MDSGNKRAAVLAKEGLQLWEEGRLEAALLKYVAALDAADPDHSARPDYHGECAGVLATLGRDAEAFEQYQIALTHALRQDSDGRGPVVAVARYSLGEQLLKMKQPERALHVITQGVRLAGDQEWLLRVVEARALWDLGRKPESKRAAERAVLHAPSDTKANDLRRYLAEILAVTS
jgi:tetratricopeptide (TPR) repeat protein